MPARLFILRTPGGRRLLVLAIIAALVAIVLSVIAPRLKPTSTYAFQRVEVHVHAVDEFITEAHVHDGDCPSPDDAQIATVVYVGATSQRWDELFRRRDLTYWSSREVEHWDGDTYEPDNVLELMTAADSTFEATLPGGSASFLWDRGVKTWRQSEFVADSRQAVSIGAFWLWVATAVTAAIAWTLAIAREIGARRRHRQGRCWRCGYDTTAAVCPECGLTTSPERELGGLDDRHHP